MLALDPTLTQLLKCWSKVVVKPGVSKTSREKLNYSTKEDTKKWFARADARLIFFCTWKTSVKDSLRLLFRNTFKIFQLLFDPSQKFRLKIEAHDKLVIQSLFISTWENQVNAASIKNRENRKDNFFPLCRARRVTGLTSKLRYLFKMSSLLLSFTEDQS